MQKQHVDNQRGEIEFRKRLCLQQTTGEKLFDGEYNKESGENLLKARMETTLSNMTVLRQKNVPLSPYLEIGAERGQRSLVMENEIGACGAAADISFDMLRSCNYYKGIFAQNKMPLRLCCDANNLPLRSNSLPYIFCYETLHHFPEPGPIIAEIYRVLSWGGFFSFDEEPYKQVLHWNLYQVKGHSEVERRRNIVRKSLDRFFAKHSWNEQSFGVIENHEISTSQWKDSLSLFEKKEAWLRPSNGASLRSELFNPSSWLKYLVAYLMGGTISGLCRKQVNGSTDTEVSSIEEALICPSCRLTGAEHLLAHQVAMFTCPACAKQYPIVDGVAFLFEYRKFKELYSDVFSSLHSDNNRGTD